MSTDLDTEIIQTYKFSARFVRNMFNIEGFIDKIEREDDNYIVITTSKISP